MVLVRSPRWGPAPEAAGSSSPLREPRVSPCERNDAGSPFPLSSKSRLRLGTERQLPPSAAECPSFSFSSSPLPRRPSLNADVSGIPHPRLSSLDAREGEEGRQADESRGRAAEEGEEEEKRFAASAGDSRGQAGNLSRASAIRSSRPKMGTSGVSSTTLIPLPSRASSTLRHASSPSRPVLARLSSSSPVGSGRGAQLAAPATAAREDAGHSDLSPSSVAAFSPSKRLRRTEDQTHSFLSQPSEPALPALHSVLTGSEETERAGFKSMSSSTASRSSPLKTNAIFLMASDSRQEGAPAASAEVSARGDMHGVSPSERISVAEERISPLSSRCSRRAPASANEVPQSAALCADKHSRNEKLRELENLQHVLPASGSLREYVQQAGEEARWRERGDSGPFSLPKTAEEFRDQWRPMVDATVKKLCDMTDEEKQVTRYIMLEGRMLRAVRRASASLANRRTKAVAFNSEVRDLFSREQRLYDESEREFEVVQRVAQDQAGGQEKLEKRLKDTQRKKEQVEVYRQQVHKKMANLSFTRQKKLRLFEALESAKKESSSKEKSLQALYQLLQCTTRFKVNKVDGGLVTGALVPEQKSALFPQLRKVGKNAQQIIKHGEGDEEDMLEDTTAEPAILTLDCEKENQGGMDADVLWSLIEDTLGVGGVPVPQLLSAVRGE
ncbi:putative Ppg3 [Toxoplasma gondii ARI]|uniref:Putative Ppg3 n=1 Tax=Toxoplasma gondii ARI TaxID=1074872 RepID=A0A139XXU3_TOXGO|nr:putative Ppg3 [Toxoplasma gondii ARI]